MAAVVWGGSDTATSSNWPVYREFVREVSSIVERTAERMRGVLAAFNRAGRVVGPPRDSRPGDALTARPRGVDAGPVFLFSTRREHRLRPGMRRLARAMRADQSLC